MAYSDAMHFVQNRLEIFNQTIQRTDHQKHLLLKCWQVVATIEKKRRHTERLFKFIATKGGEEMNTLLNASLRAVRE